MPIFSTLHDPTDVPVLGQVEHHHVDVVVAAEADRRRVGHLEPAGQELVVRQLVELHRAGVAVGVRVVDAVDTLLAHEDHLGADLERALGGDGVGREVRHPGAGAEDDGAALLEVPDGPPRDVGLGDLAHRDGRLDAGLDTVVLEEVLQRQAVHDRAQHAHVVRAGALHAALLQLGAAEEVAAADDDRDLDAAADDLGDLTGDLVDHDRVDPDLAAAEHLARQLQEHPLVARHACSRPLLVARVLGAVVSTRGHDERPVGGVL